MAPRPTSPLRCSLRSARIRAPLQVGTNCTFSHISGTSLFTIAPVRTQPRPSNLSCRKEVLPRHRLQSQSDKFPHNT